MLDVSCFRPQPEVVTEDEEESGGTSGAGPGASQMDHFAGVSIKARGLHYTRSIIDDIAP